jgi:hypothetical protein
MAEIKSESVADFIPESVADFTRNTQVSAAEVRSSAVAVMGLLAERAAYPVAEVVAEPGLSYRAKAVGDTS